MKKYITSALSILAAWDLYAGTMEKPHKLMIKEPRKVYSFVGLEGGYTWNKLNGLKLAFNTPPDPECKTNCNFNGKNLLISTVNNNAGGSGRLSTGIMRSVYEDSLFLGGEVGWGYYGETTQMISILGFGLLNAPLNFKIAGFDTLVGLTYNQQNYDIFLKAGALFRNTYFKTNTAIGIPGDTNGGFTDFSLLYKLAETQVLPIIKGGATYHYNDNLGLTLSYAHAFSYETALKINYETCRDDPGSGFSCSSASELVNILLKSSYNTSLDIVMAGIQYRLD